MLPESTLLEVQSLDIVDVIGSYIKLEKKGSNYFGCCPFHNEKTPSLRVRQNKNSFRCYGCQESGDGIAFVMKHENKSFPEAVTLMARAHNIPVPEEQSTPEQQEKFRHMESLRASLTLAAKFYVSNLYLPENALALEYVKSRWDDDTITEFQIGFAPDGWHNLMNHAKETGINEKYLLELGLLNTSKERTFDYFRNRIIFPITDEMNRVIGFTGRDFSGHKDAPKYFNSPDSAIYKKGKTLYGLSRAKLTAKSTGNLYLVEGNADTLKMHEIGVTNTVCTGGTALTDDQIRLIKKHASSVTIIGDTDTAGKKAVDRSAEMLLKAGVFVNLVTLPDPVEGEKKQDPDSFFTSRKIFDEYETSHKVDYILNHVKQTAGKKKLDAFSKSKLVEFTCSLIASLPENTHEDYMEDLTQYIKPKKTWLDALKALKKEPEKTVKKREDIPFDFLPEGVDPAHWIKYGFYEKDNSYTFNTQKGRYKLSNFKLEPMFHISSYINAKRLYKITNEFGYTQVIEIPQRDLISLAGFKLRIESLGNFLFTGADTELGKLKAWLYDQTLTCNEITQLGWQKEHGFFAWSNGIYNGSFTTVDENGIVKFHDSYFYSPSSSAIYKNETTLFMTERKFRFDPGTVTLNRYAEQLVKVYGEQAMFCICFYMASLFRDFISSKFGFFPILNLFGQKGTGKTELAISLINFFGKLGKGPNLTNTTKAALADHVSMFSNSLCHIDEYKNNVEVEKIEFLKGLWDGTGRSKMNMDKDKKKETSAVDCAIVLSGQEMPNADNALFSRLIFLAFSQVEFTEEAKANFEVLKDMEKSGLTHITHEILSQRKYFVENFMQEYSNVCDILNGILGGETIEDRIFRNWVVILASYKVLSGRLTLPFDSAKFYSVAVSYIKRQNTDTKKGNEVNTFWKIVEFLAMDGLIKEEVDFKISSEFKLSTDLVKAEYSPPKTLLFINHSRMFQLYRVHGNKTREPIIPLKTLEYYLQNSKEYLGCKRSVAFKVEENGKIDNSVGSGIDNEGKVKRLITNAYVFDYDSLDINIGITYDTAVSSDASILP